MLSRGKKEGLDPITGFSFYIKAFFLSVVRYRFMVGPVFPGK